MSPFARPPPPPPSPSSSLFLDPPLPIIPINSRNSGMGNFVVVLTVAQNSCECLNL